MPATIIIPAYNEEQGITEVLEELCGVFDDGAVFTLRGSAPGCRTVEREARP